MKTVFRFKQYIYDLFFGHCWSDWKRHPFHPAAWRFCYCCRCHKHKVEFHPTDDACITLVNFAFAPEEGVESVIVECLCGQKFRTAKANPSTKCPFCTMIERKRQKEQIELAKTR